MNAERAVRYPRVICNLTHLEENVRQVALRCHSRGIGLAGVVKGVNALLPVVEGFLAGGCDQVASSRVHQLAAMRRRGMTAPTMLVRAPMLCELEEMAKWCDYSLQSALPTLLALEQVCATLNCTHKVVLMVEMGDLREGWWDREELVAAAVAVERHCPHLELAGIGTNLGCYGAIVPTPEKMEELVVLARRVEGEIGRSLELISGGATSSYLLVHRGQMPQGINHLRVGEGILNHVDLPQDWGVEDMDYLRDDIFTLQAQVVECRDKPTHPIGQIFMDAFGNFPTYQDRGIRRRALVALGRLDYGDVDKLRPRQPEVQVIGAASDHTILDVQDCPWQVEVGSILEFDLNYRTMLYLTAREDVSVDYVRT